MAISKIQWFRGFATLCCALAAAVAHAGTSAPLSIPIAVTVGKTAATTTTPTISGGFVYSVACTPSPGGHAFATPAATINLNGAAPVSGNATAVSNNNASSSTNCVVTQTSRPAAPAGYLWVNSPAATSTGAVNTGVAPFTTTTQSFTNTLAQAITITGVASPVAGGTVTCTPNPVEVGVGFSSCSASASSGYTFTAWDGSAASACPGSVDGGFFVNSPTKDCTVTALFALVNVPITTVANPIAGGTVTCTPNPVPNGNTSSCSATANANYHLVNVSGCGGTTSTSSPYTTGAVTTPCTVTANFALDTHVVTGAASPLAGGTVNCTSPVNHGSTTSCTAAPSSGYSLTGISGCGGTPGTTSPYTTGAVIANCTVTGTFALNTFPITTVASPAAGGSVTCTPNPVNSGATSSCSAAANAGYTFTGISGCGGTASTASQYATGAVTSACTVTATFSLNTYPITSLASPAGAGTVTCTPTPVAFGATTTCTASANAGFLFANMGGCGVANAASTTLTSAAVTSACTVTGNFVALAPAVAVPGPSGAALVALALLLALSAGWLTARRLRA